MAKGVNFLFAGKYIENKYSPETWGRVMHCLSDEAKTVWTGVLLAGSEYPFAAFKEMTSCLNKELKTAKDPELAAIYEYIADQSLSKTYKIFFKFANPSFVIRNYPKLWGMFFNAGTVEVPVAESGHAVVKFILPEIFSDWLPPACLGYSKKAVEMAGGKGLVMSKVSTGKTSDDLWETAYDLRWTE
jgi:hypothetical protein